jgi:hypothetical protein
VHGGGVRKSRHDDKSALYVADVDSMPCICAIVARRVGLQAQKHVELVVE